MTRIYLKLLVGIVVFSSLALASAPILGRFRPANPVIEGIFMGCTGQPQPCWNGIRPGSTTLSVALTKINKTAFYSLNQRGQVWVAVYRDNDMRCGVELRSEADVIDSITILNCYDQQVGDVVKAMRNVNHKLPFSMGMLDAVSYDEARDNGSHEIPCLNYTSFGQIIGMPLGISGEVKPTAPSNWHDFLPYGWYVHMGGSLTCDVVEG